MVSQYMAFYKRKRTGYSQAGGRKINQTFKFKRVGRKSGKKARMNIPKMVNKIMAKKLETKTSNVSSSAYQQIGHNNFISLDTSFLRTTQGTGDPMAGNDGNRIGDEITLKGISLKFMLELNERYSDVTFRILVVRAARGDVPSAANLFTGLSGNKMMDTINRERYTIVAQKYAKLKSPNMTAGDAPSLAATGSGIYVAGGSSTANYLSRATRIVRMYIPGVKIARNGLIKYENGGTSQKFFDYHVLVYAYSNFSTSEALGFNVGAVSTYMKQLYYTDA